MNVASNTIVAIDTRLAKRIQVGDDLSVEITVRNTFPRQRVLRQYRVLVVDRINELVECCLVNEQEVCY